MAETNKLETNRNQYKESRREALYKDQQTPSQIKKKREKIRITKTRDGNVDNSICIEELQRIIEAYFKNKYIYIPSHCNFFK